MDTYFNIRDPAGFGGRQALNDKLRGKKTNAQVKRFLDKTPTYRKFRIPKSIRRARLYCTSIGHQFQGDLFDMSRFARSNNNHRFILLVVDCFSRRVNAEPLKRKSGPLVAGALDKIFESIKTDGLLPDRCLFGTDLGTEFYNSFAEEVYKKYSVGKFALRAPKKAFLAEISGRHLLDRLYKYMHANNTKRWIDQLGGAVEARNNRRSKKLAGLSPAEVNFSNQKTVYDSLYPPTKEIDVQPLEVGQRVQIATTLSPFHKSFHGYFSDKIYQINERVWYRPGVFRYSLIDTEDGMEVSGSYYEEELYPMD